MYRHVRGGGHKEIVRIVEEDPRCAKLTLSGMAVPSKGTDIATGKAALFARHPQMKTWPADHGFGVFELRVTDVWMIAN